MGKKNIVFISVVSIFSGSTHILGVAPGVHMKFNIGRQVVPIKGVLIGEQEIEYTDRERSASVLWKTNVIYGLTNSIGLRLFIPVFLKRKFADNVSRGLSDMSLEALFIKFLQPYNVTLASLGFFAPTGSIKTAPVLGTANFNILMTAQWIHSSPHWYCSFLLRPVVSVKRKGIKAGSLLNFQYLFGPKLELCNSKLPLALLLELDGVYRKATTINGITDPNSGGTVVIFGPLVTVRKERMILQGRTQFPILQNYKGRQPKLNYLAALNMQYYF